MSGMQSLYVLARDGIATSRERLSKGFTEREREFSYGVPVRGEGRGPDSWVGKKRAEIGFFGSCWLDVTLWG